jgi:hypothetical protein
LHACRKLGGEPDGSWLAGTATAAASGNTQQQQHLVSPREAAAAAKAASAGTAAGDDMRLLRPVDPAKPGYYWKPVRGDAAAAAAAGQAALHGNDNILGFQVSMNTPECSVLHQEVFLAVVLCCSSSSSKENLQAREWSA